MPHPLHPRETDRLAALRSLAILDTPPSAALDALVACARRALNMPISLVSLIDDTRQWFKAATGLPLNETSRDVAFCNYTIAGEGIFVVEDAAADPRFSDNPLVSGDPKIRFYAGAPLTIGSGHRLGSLCVIDREPRTLSASERATLNDLALVAVALLESHTAAQRNRQLVCDAHEQRLIAEARTRELKLREHRFEQTEQFAKVGGFEADILSGALQWSDEGYRIHDLPVGVPMTIAGARKLFVDKGQLDALIRRATETGASYDDEFEIVTPTGAHKWMRMAGEVESVDGTARRFFGMIQDVSQRRAAELKLWHSANHDSLTGLANRAQCEEKIGALFAQREAASSDAAAVRGVGLLMVDVDHLKEVNDTLGHGAGDALLRAVAAGLSTAVGDGFVSRVGGDEFVVLIEGEVSSGTLERLGRATIAAMVPTILQDGHVVRPQVSVGAAFAAPGDTGDLLRQKADLALYRCKQVQRGGYTEFRDDMRSAVLHRAATLRNVEQALAESRMFPYYQPLVRLDTGEIMALEALARMRMPDGTIVAAGAFQEALAEHRIAYSLTGQMLSQVADDARHWLDAGRPLKRIGLNVTTADFQAGDLRQRVMDAFSRVDVSLQHLVIEVTEMVFMSGNEAAAVRDLQALRDAGAFVALDDFGTGYASLTQLRTLPVDVIKIDKSFVNRMLVETTSGSIVEGLVDLALKLGLNVVAEGVETVEQAEHLHALGCHFGQGYLFARPADAATAGTLMARFAERSGTAPETRPGVMRLIA